MQEPPYPEIEAEIPDDIIEACDEYVQIARQEFDVFLYDIYPKSIRNDTFEDLEYPPNASTKENIPQSLTHLPYLGQVYEEVVRYLPELGRTDIYDFEQANNTRARGHTVGGAAIDQRVISPFLTLDFTKEAILHLINRRLSSISAALATGGYPPVDLEAAQDHLELIASIILMHEFGHTVHRDVRTRSLIDQEYAQQKDNQQWDGYGFTYTDHSDGEKSISQERQDQLRISPLKMDIVETQIWIADAPLEEKVRKYHELKGLGVYSENVPSEEELDAFCKRIYKQTEYVYTHLSSEVFANLFACHCIRELPTLKALFEKATHRSIDSIAY